MHVPTLHVPSASINTHARAYTHTYYNALTGCLLASRVQWSGRAGSCGARQRKDTGLPAARGHETAGKRGRGITWVVGLQGSWELQVKGVVAGVVESQGLSK
jgi:hypothetical protein